LNKAIFGPAADNVATCCVSLAAGDSLTGDKVQVTALQPIPIYHKIAIRPIAKGEKIFKYGQPIGVASADIAPGEHVHVHNLESDRGRGDRK
jgi:altronate dehydratase small subunit